MGGYAVHSANTSAQVTINYGTQLAVSQLLEAERMSLSEKFTRKVSYPDVVEVPADFFYVDVSLESDPATTEPSSVVLWVSYGNPQKTGISFAHLELSC